MFIQNRKTLFNNILLFFIGGCFVFFGNVLLLFPAIQFEDVDSQSNAESFLMAQDMFLHSYSVSQSNIHVSLSYNPANITVIPQLAVIYQLNDTYIFSGGMGMSKISGSSFESYYAAMYYQNFLNDSTGNTILSGIENRRTNHSLSKNRVISFFSIYNKKISIVTVGSGLILDLEKGKVFSDAETFLADNWSLSLLFSVAYKNMDTSIKINGSAAGIGINRRLPL